MVKYTITYPSLILAEIDKKVKQNSSVDSRMRQVLLGRKSIQRLNCADEKKFLLLSLCIYDILLRNRFESVKSTLNIRRNWRINAVTRF
jgi:hypothetical protein